MDTSVIKCKIKVNSLVKKEDIRTMIYPFLGSVKENPQAVPCASVMSGESKRCTNYAPLREGLRLRE